MDMFKCKYSEKETCLENFKYNVHSLTFIMSVSQWPFHYRMYSCFKMVELNNSNASLYLTMFVKNVNTFCTTFLNEFLFTGKVFVLRVV